MAPGLPPQPDSSATAICYSTASTCCYITNFTYDPKPARDLNLYELRMFQREFGRYAEDCYAELLRTLNYQPSVDGVKTKKARFNQLMAQVRSLWVRHVRFDLRQPCWRSGRWKSLTA